MENARYLIQQGADPAVQDHEGNDFLHLAAWRGHIGIVKILLRDGFDVTATNHADQKPIDLAQNEKSGIYQRLMSRSHSRMLQWYLFTRKGQLSLLQNAHNPINALNALPESIPES